MRRALLGSVGSVPARNSCRLLNPSPSGSHPPHELLLFVSLLPKNCCRHQSGMPSPTLSRQTVVVALAILFAVNGSNSPASTIAVFVMLVMLTVAVGVPTIVTVAMPLLTRLPRSQITIPPIFVQAP